MSYEPVEVKIARIDENVKEIRRLMANHIEDDAIVHKDHEQRIRRNEKFRNALLGAFGVTGVSAGGWSVLDLFK